MPSLHRVWLYTRRVASHWKAFVVTSGPGTVLAFVATVLNWTVPIWVWVALIIAGLFAAQFQTFEEVSNRRGARSAGPRLRLISDPVATDGYYKTTTAGFGSVSPPREVSLRRMWRFHISQASDGVSLVCQGWQRGIPTTVACQVEDPDGRRWTGRLRKAGESRVGCTFPTDFDAAPKNGLYFVHWLFEQKQGGDELAPMADPLDFTLEVNVEQ
jgi:hypothetical protein